MKTLEEVREELLQIITATCLILEDLPLDEVNKSFYNGVLSNCSEVLAFIDGKEEK